MPKKGAKKTALVHTNQFQRDPKSREDVTVLAVSTANRLEGMSVTRKVTRENYRLVSRSR